ncbi:MAG: sulfite exporter TauE/SafE family protein [Rickettsiales bacterium]|jgi:uncharacterized membrane protein YfcA
MFDSALWSPENMAIVAAVLLLAGFVKGVVGLGLPTVSLGLLTAVFGLKAAIALMLVPSFATNVVQGALGGSLGEIMRRLWVLLVVACIAIWLSSALLAGSDTALLSVVLGLSLCLYSGLSLTRPQVAAPPEKERWLSPLVGAVNGALTGLTGSFVVPGVLYLQALGMPRDVFIQAMGVLFTVSTVALAFSMSGRGLLPTELGLLSCVGLVPAFVGMYIGQKLRKRLSEERFRQVFFVSVGVLGAYIIARSLL